MFIKDGIAYADDQEPAVRILNVRPLEDYKLLIRFTNHEDRVFDMEPYLNEGVFKALRDKSVFDRVYVEYGTLTWNDGEIDIAPETVYDGSVPSTRHTAT